MKKSDEIRAKITTLKAKAQALVDKDDVKLEELQAIRNDIATAENKLAIQEDIEKAAGTPAPNAMAHNQVNPLETKQKDTNEKYKVALYNCLRGRGTVDERDMLVQNALSSGVPADGGYLIPADQQTAIKELMRELNPLRDLVNVETVTTLSGSRNIEKDAAHTPFPTITEGATIAESDSPEFQNVPFTIKTKGGVMTIPNTLMADNTANLEAYINRWLAKKGVATENALIISILSSLTGVAVSTFDDVKKIINVTLDPSISAMATALTNQDGYNYLDTLKNSDGDYLMQKSPVDPTKKMLLGVIPVRVVSNKTLTTTDNVAPLYIGSFSEGVTLFDREAISLLSTNIGAGSFETNSTKVRAIMRLDSAQVDTSAIVKGEITIA
jgi:HK97 family phage major capsid protein